MPVEGGSCLTCLWKEGVAGVGWDDMGERDEEGSLREGNLLNLRKTNTDETC